MTVLADVRTLTELDDLDVDEPTAAAKILAELGVPATAARLLAPAVTAYLIVHRRNTVRGTERASFRRTFPGADDLLRRVHAEQQLADLLPLLSQPFRVERNGEVVTWGDASPVQHRRRAAELRRHASATVATAERHEQVAVLCEAAGVGSFRELIERTAA